MRKPLLKARQLLLLAYLLAAVLWVVRCLVGCGVMLNYKLQGKMPQTHVDAAELMTESFAPYSSNEWWTPPDDDPAWYLSTDSDPHIYWQGQGYIETVVLDAAHRLPPGGVALYYVKPGQTDYSEAQKVYARVTAPGVYTFDLGGQWVTGLRIDPDSRQVFRAGQPIELTQREYELLSFLAARPNKVYSRADLMEQVWNYDYVGDDARTVDVTVRRLREKVEADPANPVHILTRRGAGYYFAK